MRYRSGRCAGGVWRSLVARFVRDEEAAGSNPATPTGKRQVTGHLARPVQLPGVERGAERRVEQRGCQSRTLHSWTFAQLGQYIAYKAVLAGVPVVYVDPAYTSQMCSACGHVSKKNRPDQATFCCTSCGFAEHADVNAARNIAVRGVLGWAVSHAADDAARACHPGRPV